jgi:hypothetical protein
MVEFLQDATSPLVRINHCGSEIGMVRMTSPDASNYWDGAATQYWSHANLPGYIRADGYPNCNIYHQDYSLRTGVGAWADLLIADTEDIDDAHVVYHPRILSWSSSGVTADNTHLSDVDFTGMYLIPRLADDTHLPGRLL